MPSIPYIAKPVASGRDAVASHMRWRITLLLATQMHEPLSDRANRSIHHPEECSIHKWLASPQTLHLRRTPEYHSALTRHFEFHTQMQRIADLINSGDFDHAGRLLASPESFQNASNALANALMALDRCRIALSA
jgi:hypothetical protein